MNLNPAPELAPQLKQLRLSGIFDSLEARNRQAIEAKLAYTDFLALLISDEVARREQKKFSTRLRRAQFRTTKTLEQFDFERLPQLNRALDELRASTKAYHMGYVLALEAQAVLHALAPLSSAPRSRCCCRLTEPRFTSVPHRLTRPRLPSPARPPPAA
jgi:hypothetical protein